MLIKNPNTKKQTSIPTIGRIYHSYIHNRPYHFSTLNTYYNKCHLIIHCHNVKSMGSFGAIVFQDVIGKLSQNDEVKISQRSTWTLRSSSSLSWCTDKWQPNWEQIWSRANRSGCLLAVPRQTQTFRCWQDIHVDLYASTNTAITKRQPQTGKWIAPTCSSMPSCLGSFFNTSFEFGAKNHQQPYLHVLVK